jgi:hypothetical protein
MDIVDFLLLCIGCVGFVIAFVIARFVGQPWMNVIVIALCTGLLVHQVAAYSMVAYSMLIRKKHGEEVRDSNESESEDEI